ncbi:MAG TPA: hypothetical protein VLL77_06365, partial [Anaerolineales bacterium]|nr:hypothetical protein [Anaerolineales bacterium]
MATLGQKLGELRGNFWAAVVTVLLAAAGFRAVLLWHGAFPFNADEAVVGLMARHVLQGDLPIFFYGQAYLGSLDALLVAAGFAVSGPSVLVIRVVQVAIYLATILTTMLLTREIGLPTRTSAVAGLLLAVPPVLVTLYTTVSLGGYGEALLLGSLILLVTLRMIRSSPTALAVGGWGVLSGFALWTFGLTLVYSIPGGVFLLGAALRGIPTRAKLGKISALTLGVMAGALPMLLWAAAHGPSALFQELLGSAIAGASPSDLPSAIGLHLVNLVLFAPTVVFGLRPPWDIVALGMPLTPIIAALWIAALARGVRQTSWPAGGRAGRWLLGGVASLTVAGFLLTGFGADPSGRYFLPVFQVLAIFAAAGVTAWTTRFRPAVIALLFGLVIGFNLWSNLQVANRSPFFTTQFDAATRYDHRYDDQLVAFLEERGERTGY